MKIGSIMNRVPWFLSNLSDDELVTKINEVEKLQKEIDFKVNKLYNVSYLRAYLQEAVRRGVVLTY